LKNRLQLLIFSSLFFVNVSVIGQSKAKAEKQFLMELNTILKNAKQYHWDYEGKVSIDSPFTISKTGILSVTVRYNENGSLVRARMDAPVNKIKNVLYDLYLILEFEEPLVNIYTSKPGTLLLKKKENSQYFHIAAPVKEGYQQEKRLQQLLENLMKFYH
jgi:hypothetical protein